MNAGRLVAFEGLDGSGKTTQLARAVVRLRERGREVIATREPTDGEHGRRIRALAARGERAPAAEELALFQADRREHVANRILPALARGAIVLTDRYFLSTVAYQGARGLDPGTLLAESESAFPPPDLAILFEIDPARALARVHARGGQIEEAFERLDRLQRVAAVFASIDRPYLVRVDADRDEEAVARSVSELLASRLDLLP